MGLSTNFFRYSPPTDGGGGNSDMSSEKTPSKDHRKLNEKKGGPVSRESSGQPELPPQQKSLSDLASMSEAAPTRASRKPTSQGNRRQSSEIGRSSPGSEILNLPAGQQAGAVEELSAAQTSRDRVGFLSREVSVVLYRLASRGHVSSLPREEGKALFREVADATLHCRTGAQQKIVGSLVESFIDLKEPSLQDFDVLLEAIRWTLDDEDQSWFNGLDLDTAISSLSPQVQPIASERAQTLRVSRTPALFGRLSPVQARSVFDGVIDEIANHGNAQALQIVKGLFEGFSAMQAPSLDDFALLLDVASKIAYNEGRSPYEQLEFDSAIAALPEAQQADAIALLVGEPAACGAGRFLVPSVTHALFELGQPRHLAKLSALQRQRLMGALGDASKDVYPGQRWKLNKLLARAAESGTSQRTKKMPDAD